MTLHTFGFTDEHDALMLQALALSGNAGCGLYYSFLHLSDIAPAIGDCLGSVSLIAGYPSLSSFLPYFGFSPVIICPVTADRYNVTVRGYDVHKSGKETAVAFYSGSDSVVLSVPSSSSSSSSSKDSLLEDGLVENLGTLSCGQRHSLIVMARFEYLFIYSFALLKSWYQC